MRSSVLSSASSLIRANPASRQWTGSRWISDPTREVVVTQQSPTTKDQRPTRTPDDRHIIGRNAGSSDAEAHERHLQKSDQRARTRQIRRLPPRFSSGFRSRFLRSRGRWSVVAVVNWAAIKPRRHVRLQAIMKESPVTVVLLLLLYPLGSRTMGKKQETKIRLEGKLEPCPGIQNTGLDLDNLRFARGLDGQQNVEGSVIVKDFFTDLTFHLMVDRKTRGGFENFINYDFPELCENMDNVDMPWGDFFIKNFNATSCPIPPGTYPLHPIDLELNKWSSRNRFGYRDGYFRIQLLVKQGPDLPLACLMFHVMSTVV